MRRPLRIMIAPLSNGIRGEGTYLIRIGAQDEFE